MKDNIIKVCFIVDCTSSMGRWIQAAKNKILDTLTLILTDNPNYHIYASFIGYRDVGDKEKIIQINFTDDIDSLRSSIMDIKAEGGDDIPEDVSQPFRIAAEFNWDADVKIAFFITDAPNHGLTYHMMNIEDEYPNGYGNIDLKEEVRILAYKGVDLTVFRINDSTDMMFNIMKQQYGNGYENKFKTINLVNSRQSADRSFETEVYTSIHHSIAMSQETTFW